VIPASVTHDLEPSSPDALGRLLDARYVISGTVRQREDRIRITARLIDAESGAQIWAETFDGENTATGLFDLQAHVARRIVVSIADPTGVIKIVESNALISRPTDSLQAYECVLRAHAYLRIHDNETHALAKDCLIRAVELDPGYAEAWGQLAYLYREELQHNRPSETPESLQNAVTALNRALELDRNHPRVAFAQAMVAFSSGDTVSGAVHSRRAAALNPNDASILAVLGIYLAQMGEIDEAEELGMQVLELHPTPPFWIHMVFATVSYLREDYQACLEATARWDQPDDVQWHYHRISALAELGRTEEAERAARQMHAQFPRFSADPAAEIRKYMFVPATREPFLAGLAKAGLVSAAR
jgi:tetratricopeptide (TPR) repeat protein